MVLRDPSEEIGSNQIQGSLLRRDLAEVPPIVGTGGQDSTVASNQKDRSLKFSIQD